jgi:hypothetical protein
LVGFAGDLPVEEQKLVWATHQAPVADRPTTLFREAFSRTAPSRIDLCDGHTQHVPLIVG